MIEVVGTRESLNELGERGLFEIGGRYRGDSDEEEPRCWRLNDLGVSENPG